MDTPLLIPFICLILITLFLLAMGMYLASKEEEKTEEYDIFDWMDE
jgi:hypothetical protein